MATLIRPLLVNGTDQAIATSLPLIQSVQVHFYDVDNGKVWGETFVLYAVVLVL